MFAACAAIVAEYFARVAGLLAHKAVPGYADFSQQEHRGSGMSGYVGASHEFHDADFVRGWSNRFVPTRERLALFDMIADQISQPSVPHAHVVELGIGPGYMARHILERNRAISYEGVDFSQVFLRLPGRRPAIFCIA